MVFCNGHYLVAGSINATRPPWRELPRRKCRPVQGSRRERISPRSARFLGQALGLVQEIQLCRWLRLPASRRLALVFRSAWLLRRLGLRLPLARRARVPEALSAGCCRHRQASGCSSTAGYARRLFEVTRVCDNEQYNRIYTLELLFERYQPAFADRDASSA